MERITALKRSILKTGTALTQRAEALPTKKAQPPKGVEGVCSALLAEAKQTNSLLRELVRLTRVVVSTLRPCAETPATNIR